MEESGDDSETHGSRTGASSFPKWITQQEVNSPVDFLSGFVAILILVLPGCLVILQQAVYLIKLIKDNRSAVFFKVHVVSDGN